MPTDPYGTSSGDPDDGERRAARQESNDAWSAFGLMVSGVVIWGGAGYLVARWTGYRLFTMVGVLVGMSAALYGVWLRYGRS